ncbi:MAG: hypothetical protein AAGA15_15015 [Pseudomonadota bacterium]
MSWWEFAVTASAVGLVSAPVAFAQAYFIAGLINAVSSASLNTTGDKGPHAPLRRWNWLFLLPLPVTAATMESGRTYAWPDVQAIVTTFAVPAFLLGLARVFRDSVDRRFGPSIPRLKGAYIYSAVASVVVAIFAANLAVKGS